LAEFAGPGAINTDDRPVVLFQAPAFAYSSRGSATDLLLEVVQGLAAEPDDILFLQTENDPANAVDRLDAYWVARNQFITVGAEARRTQNAQMLLAQVQGPLLSIIEKSPDFSPAYRPLLALAKNLRPREPAVAWELLKRLEQVAPRRHEAQRLRRNLFN
jgi:spermidine synthase